LKIVKPFLIASRVNHIPMPREPYPSLRHLSIGLGGIG